MTSASVPEAAHWSAGKKVVFRFFFAFFLLFMVIEPGEGMHFYDWVFYPFINYFQGFIIWAAKHALNLTVPQVTWTAGYSGGDSTIDYLLLLFITVFAVVIAIIWSFAGRRATNYNKLLYWLLVALRYFVAFTMVFFSVEKIFRLQFPELTITRLMERVGDMSPMGLAWTYMSYSTAFNYFTGFAELLCAASLLFRRTATLGAVAGIALLANIVAINYCFDVCVKQTSTMLLVMCFVILIHDYERLINLFFRNRATVPVDQSQPRFTAGWKNAALKWIKVFVILLCAYMNYIQTTEWLPLYAYPPKPPLYGLYNVETFIKNRDTLKPLATDTLRWNKLWITRRAGTAVVKYLNDSLKTYIFKTDTLKHLITSYLRADTVHKYYLHYTRPKPDELILQGQWRKDSIYVKMHQVDINSFRLINRGFHMINEDPYNR